METPQEVRSDFKEGAARLVRETGKPIAQVVRELGVNDTLGNWVALGRRRRDSGNGELSEDERVELVQLRRRCAELELRRVP
jgi:transposase